ncbi:MAG: A/G-specific adenine glycosylase [Candidatus Thermoplasmatota archaeon]
MEPSHRRRLLAWYRRTRRDLPWRQTSDPYAILVSEVMLQQTRVEVATPYFLRWMERFPTLQALAAADEQEVMAAWAGLGYYQRARNLQALAKQVVAKHGGRLPDAFAKLLELPGIGPYTAGAVASIAFGKRVPCVDGNVVRVASRILALRGPDSPALRRRIEAAAASWVPERAPGDWNQALMELGATVCLPRNPRCEECPVAAACAARAKGVQHAIPRPAARKAAAPETMRFALVQQAGTTLLVRNPERGLLAGMWMLPGGSATAPLPRTVLAQTGVRIRAGASIATARHIFSHRTWAMELQRASILDVGHAQPALRTWWCPDDELAGAALPTAMRRLLKVVDDGKP